MTWAELAVVIGKMSEADCKQDVRFIEPYDETVGYTLEIQKAAEDIYTGDDGEEDDDPFINQGEYFLS